MLERALVGLQEGTGFSRWKGLSLTSALWDRVLVLTVSWLLIYMIKDVLRKDGLKAQAHHWQKKHTASSQWRLCVSQHCFSCETSWISTKKRQDAPETVGFYSVTWNKWKQCVLEWNIGSMRMFGSECFASSVVFSHWTNFLCVLIHPPSRHWTNVTNAWLRGVEGAVCSQQDCRTLANTAYESTWEQTHTLLFHPILSLSFSVKAWQVQTPVYNRVGIKEVLLKKTEERKWWLSIFNNK